MNFKTIYVINYKETEIDEENVMDVKSGTCEFGYTDEAEAIKRVDQLAEEQMNRIIDEGGEPWHEENDNRDCQTVGSDGPNTYEYWVSNVDVEVK